MGRDWDDAYNNFAHVPDGESYLEIFPRRAAEFRETCCPDGLRAGLSYGPHTRERVDLFLPEGRPLGVLIFVHGGYWRRFAPSDHSHLAEGAVRRGWAVAMPGYVLAPEARITDITRSIGSAVRQIAGTLPGPIVLSGHSAGGHLAVRQVCDDTRLEPRVLRRIRRVVPISGVHDLRPLLRTQINDSLRMDAAEAAAESPVLREPVAELDVHVWVGDAERPEFVRQSTLLANVWSGFDIQMSQTIVPERHHFDVIDEMCDPDSNLVAVLTGE